MGIEAYLQIRKELFHAGLKEIVDANADFGRLSASQDSDEAWIIGLGNVETKVILSLILHQLAASSLDPCSSQLFAMYC